MKPNTDRLNRRIAPDVIRFGNVHLKAQVTQKSLTEGALVTEWALDFGSILETLGDPRVISHWSML